MTRVFPQGPDSPREEKEDFRMDAARASVEVQIVMAVGAFFALMVFIAALDWW